MEISYMHCSRYILLLQIAFALCLLSIRDSAAKDIAELFVEDEQGNPVPNFQVGFFDRSTHNIIWIDGVEGGAFISQKVIERSTAFDLVVRSDGFASTFQNFNGEYRKALLNDKAIIKLARGRQIELQFVLPEELSWPDSMVPVVAFSEFKKEIQALTAPAILSYRRQKFPASMPPDFNMLNVKAVSPGKFTFRVAADTPSFFIAVNTPRFLQCFFTEPYKATDIHEGKITVELPKPAKIEVTFKVTLPEEMRSFKSALIDVAILYDGPSNFAGVGQWKITDDKKPVFIEDLPPGEYQVFVKTVPQDDQMSAQKRGAIAGKYSDDDIIKLKAGETKSVNFKYKVLDEKTIQGNRTAVVRITGRDNKPLIGSHIEIIYNIPHYVPIVVFSGKLPESGEITLSDLSDAMHDSRSRPYIVYANGRRLGAFQFKQRAGVEQFNFHK